MIYQNYSYICHVKLKQLKTMESPEIRLEIEKILDSYEFKRTEIPNAFKRGRYSAVIWPNNSNFVTFTVFSPKVMRYMGSDTYEKVTDLKERLKKLLIN